MKTLSHLIYKVTLSSMIVTAPAMTTGSNADANYGITVEKETTPSYLSSTVIKRFVNYTSLVFKPVYTAHEAFVNAAKTAVVDKPRTADRPAIPEKIFHVNRAASRSRISENLAIVDKSTAHRAELAMVINQAVLLYDHMNLQKSGLDEKAFEYAWRGYHNLVKKGLLRKKNVLSICDFSQSSHNKRMYVIDIRHKKLLYRTYVAHGQNSGSEFANSFSNKPDSYKSSLGFYITSKTYYGRNGLSLKIEGVDTGYNDLASKRNIVLHGCSYIGVKYLHHYGNEGTSLGCPAIPNTISPRVIQVLKHGSCLFIYHPTQEYLDGSSVLNNNI